MQIDVMKSVKYVFDDPLWVKKLLLIVGIQVGVAIVSQVLQVGSSITPYLLTPFQNTLGDSEIFIGIVSAMVPFFIQIAAMLITIPLQFYIFGYFMENRINVMNGVENPLPENTNIQQKMYLGLMVMVVSFLPMLLFGIVMILPILLVVGLLAIVAEGGDAMILLSFILLAGVIIATVLLALVLSYLVVPAMIYLYITKGSFSAAWSYKNLMELLKRSWKSFALLGLLILALGTVVGMLTIPLIIFTCGLGLLLSPLINIYVQAVESHLWGQLYGQLKRGEV